MIQLKNVSKIFSGTDGNKVVAVNNISLTVEDGEVVCLIGSSGSGKTTAIKMVNRLIEPSEGTIEVGGVDVNSTDVIRLRRTIGYVTQSGGLFPHMTAAQNIGLLCKVEKWDSDRIDERVKELLELVQMPFKDFAERYPSELSGGQAQRVGVARALALDPDYILMDEPFGALDPITRKQIQEEFRQLLKKVNKTVILVTHDIGEAFDLGDRTVLMDKGELVQAGDKNDFLKNPTNRFAADFIRTYLD